MSLPVSGLWTNPSPIGQQVPPGGLKKANDVVIDRPGVAQPRRADDGIVLNGADPGQVYAAFDYAGTSFAWNGTALYTLDTSSGDAAFTSVGAVAWAGGTLRHATGGGDLYFTTDDGPMLLDGVTGTPALPGAPAALDAYAANIANAGAGTAGSAADFAIAARLVIGYNDAAGIPVLGEPSGRVVITQTGAFTPYDYSYTFTLPAGLTTSNFVQLYRTSQVTPPTDPGDSMYLVYERPLTALEVANKRVTIIDVTPDALLAGVPLYTNPDRGGVRSSNVRPPLAQDLVTFRERMWLANTQALHRLSVRLIATLGPSTTLTIAGQAYQVASSVTDPMTPPEQGYFEAFNGFPTVSQNIESTMRSLVDAINRKTTNTTVYAFYVSGPYDAPGQIVIQERSMGGASFTMQSATDGESFVPQIASPVSSVADVYPNRLHYSKPGVFYGFPLSNTLQVGAQEHGIARIVALRDTLLVFKENGGDGLWKVTGNGPFYVEQVNAGVQVLAPDTVVVADNTAFALTDKGIIAVSESGSVDVIDVPIADKIRDLILQHSGGIPYARAFVREANTEVKVYFGFDTDGDGNYVEESYVWNIATETWTRDTRTWRTAYVNSSGVMLRFYEGADPEMQVYVERNSGDLLADTLGVSYEVGWNTETGGLPEGQKQFNSADVLYEQTQPLSVDAELWFTADDGSQGPAVSTGGEGFPYIRAEVPFDQQRTSRLGVEIRATVTTTQANIVGMATRYRSYGTLKGR